jgi:hypothetical protein
VTPSRSSRDAAVTHPRVLSEKALAARAVAFSARNARHFRPQPGPLKASPAKDNLA